LLLNSENLGTKKQYDPRDLEYSTYVNPDKLRQIIPIFKDFEFNVNTDEMGNGGF
jgi:hypothetical protein